MWFVFFILLCIPTCPPARELVFNRFERDKHSHHIYHFLLLIRSLYREGAQRIKALNNKRWVYEKTMEYEEGFVLGEIIERYRQMVEHAKLTLKFKNYNVYDALVRTELVQKNYLDIFHLVNVAHEIPRKYGQFTKKKKRNATEKKGKKKTKKKKNNSIDVQDLLSAQKNLKKQELERKRKLKEEKKEAKEARQKMLLQQNYTSFRPRKQTRWWWPNYEYGWEIDYYW